MIVFSVTKYSTMKENIHVSYIFASEKDPAWGLTINTVGYRHAEKGASATSSRIYCIASRQPICLRNK
jgi:hypothetical protein